MTKVTTSYPGGMDCDSCHNYIPAAGARLTAGDVKAAIAAGDPSCYACHKTSGHVTGLSFQAITAEPTDTDTIEIAWSPSTDTVPGLAGYAVYRTLDDSLVGTTAATSLTETGLATGGYSYYVMAYDDAGNYSSRSRFASASVPVAYHWQSQVLGPNTYAGNPGGSTASSTFVFNSTSATVHYASGPVNGEFEIQIDGITTDTIDGYSATFNPAAQKTYTTSPGGHTLTIKPTGTKNPASAYYWTMIDGFSSGPDRYEETEAAFAWQSLSLGPTTYTANPAGSTAHADFTFNVSTVDTAAVHFATGPSQGIFDVKLDGSTIATIDGYSASFNATASALFAVTPGEHRLTVHPTGAKNVSSAFYWTLLDSFSIGGVKYPL